MKKTKKILALALAAVMLVCTTVAATVAYLTSQDSVTNTFTVGKVKITLDELDVDNSTPGENDRDKANTYKIFPGGTYEKDPIVHVSNEADVEDCYVFVKVVNGLGTSEAAVESLGTVETQMKTNGWAEVEGKENVWIYKGTGTETKVVVSKGTNLPVFTKFAVSNALDNDGLNALNNKTIVVNAYAIQADGFAEYTPAQIWTAAAFS